MNPAPLSAPQLRRLGDLLRQRRADAVGQHAALGEAMDGIREARGHTQADDEHDPEGPTMSSEWSRIVGLEAESAAELVAIDRALQRIETGSYGLCARCGEPIGMARLQARPAAELCIDCARLAG